MYISPTINKHVKFRSSLSLIFPLVSCLTLIYMLLKHSILSHGSTPPRHVKCSLKHNVLD